MQHGKARVTVGGDNVLADLGIPDPEIALLKPTWCVRSFKSFNGENFLKPNSLGLSD